MEGLACAVLVTSTLRRVARYQYVGISTRIRKNPFNLSDFGISTRIHENPLVYVGNLVKVRQVIGFQ